MVKVKETLAVLKVGKSKGRSRQRRKKAAKRKTVAVVVAPSSRMSSSWSPGQRQLYAAMLDPFSEAPPSILPTADAHFRFTMYDRRLLTLGTGGCFFYENVPTASTATTFSGGINFSLPVSANLSNAWSTANTTVTPYNSATTIQTAGNGFMGVTWAVRVVPTGVLTNSSGVLFAGVEPAITGTTSIWQSDTPNNVLSNNVTAVIGTLGDGIQAVSHNGTADILTYSVLAQFMGASTGANTGVNSTYVGLLGGQSGQTVYVESVVHGQCTVSTDSACIFQNDDLGLTVNEYEVVSRVVSAMLPHGVINSAKPLLGANIRRRLGRGGTKAGGPVGSEFASVSSGECDTLCQVSNGIETLKQWAPIINQGVSAASSVFG